MSTVRYALIGCGAFGEFCVEAFRQGGALTPVAVCDVNPDAARRTAEATGVPVRSFEEILDSREVDAVHVAVPPFAHHAPAIRALEAGKHVLVEKPIALSLPDADTLIDLAAQRDLTLAVNHMMPYSPLVETVSRLLTARAVGEIVRASLENDAQRETLPPSHWFWDAERSGGIFVEHATHFFDLFARWFGPGDVVAAASARTEGLGEDRVHAVTRHGSVLVAQTHAFTQKKSADRQAWRIVGTDGEIRLEEWIPTRLFLHAERYDATLMSELGLSPTESGYARDLGPKSPVYAGALQALAADFAASCVDPGRPMRVTVLDAHAALSTALAARAFVKR